MSGAVARAQPKTPALPESELKQEVKGRLHSVVTEPPKSAAPGLPQHSHAAGPLPNSRRGASKPPPPNAVIAQIQITSPGHKLMNLNLKISECKRQLHLLK